MRISNASHQSSLNGGSTIVLPTTPSFDYLALFAAIWRNKLKLAAWMCFCVGVAALYYVLTPPEYTAYAQIILETPKQQKMVVDEDGQPVPMDSAQADSRIQVIKSERLLRFVFDTHKSAMPQTEQPGLLRWLGLNRSEPLDEQRARQHAFLDFMDRVGAKRLGLSYVMEISYRAKTPKDAAETANAIAAAYIRDRVLAALNNSEVLQRRTADMTRDAEAWLNGVKTGTIPADPASMVDARVIGTAIEPTSKSAPKGLLTLLFAISLGMATGIGAIFMANNRDRIFRSDRQARALFGDSLLGVIDSKAPRYAYEGICALLPRERSTKIGVASWSGRRATQTVARGLAEALRCAGGVTRLQDNRQATRQSLEPEGRGSKDPSPRTTCDRAGHSEAELAKLESKDGGQTVDKRRSLACLDASAQDEQTIWALPPMSGSALEVRSMADALDCIILVVEKDVSDLDDIRAALALLNAFEVSSVGIVFYSADEDHGSLVPIVPKQLPAIIPRLWRDALRRPFTARAEAS